MLAGHARAVAWWPLLAALLGCDGQVYVDCTRRSADICWYDARCALIADRTCRNLCEEAEDCLETTPVCRQEIYAPPELEEFNPGPVQVCMPR